MTRQTRAGQILGAIAIFVTAIPVLSQASDWPDIRTVPADLQVPPMTSAQPAAGLRVRQTVPGWPKDTVYHVLGLPTDWRPDGRFPVIVEFAGNGGYRNEYGDECSGRPEDCCLGYGMSEGKGYLWICLPFLNEAGTDIALKWWGDSPTHDPRSTLRYCRETINEVIRRYGGDSSRIILCGFSRGAIACNALGLHDEQTAKLWHAFVPCSHYDGVRSWPFPGSDPASAAVRLARLNGRPQFICGEADQPEQTRRYLQLLTKDTRLTFVSTGFRNHTDQWILRPSPVRQQLHHWLQDVTTPEIRPPQ